MHIYVLARGIMKGIREWEEFMSSQYFPMDMKIKGKKVRHLAQLQVRPVKLYEVVCPEESEKAVLSMIKGQKKEQEVGSIHGFQSCEGSSNPTNFLILFNHLPIFPTSCSFFCPLIIDRTLFSDPSGHTTS